ncbi:MAG: efflux RND transporter permease subunit [Alphaproteobacteria bacterium]|nr:efflux RND transporter permease subunit [Alphaproteobacteria bacterium]
MNPRAPALALLTAMTLACGLGRTKAPPTRLLVVLPWPGASAEEVEAMMVEPMEAALLSLPGLARIAARSEEGQGTVFLDFPPGTDPFEPMGQVMDRVPNSLPQDADAPLVGVLDEDRTLEIVAYGLDLLALSAWSEALEDRLYRVPGVSRVVRQGQMELTPTIRVDPERMVALGVGTDQLLASLGPSAADPFLLRVAPEPDLGQLADVMVVGTSYRVGDIAELSMSPREGGARVWRDGEPAVRVAVSFMDTTAVEDARAEVRGVLDGLDSPVRVWLPRASEQQALRVISAHEDEVAAVAEALGAAQVLTVCVEAAPMRCEVRHWGAPPEQVEAALATAAPGAQVYAVPSGSRRALLILAGPDRAALAETADRVVERLRQDPALAEVGPPLPGPGAPEMRYTLDRNAAARLGLTTSQLADALRLAGGHQVPGPGGQELTVQLGALEDPLAQQLLLDLNGTPQLVPLRTLAEVELTERPTTLLRWETRPAVVIEVGAKRDQDILAAIAEVPLPLGVTAEVVRGAVDLGL